MRIFKIIIVILIVWIGITSFIQSIYKDDMNEVQIILRIHKSFILDFEK